MGPGEPKPKNDIIIDTVKIDGVHYVNSPTEIPSRLLEPSPGTKKTEGELFEEAMDRLEGIETEPIPELEPAPGTVAEKFKKAIESIKNWIMDNVKDRSLTKDEAEHLFEILGIKSEREFEMKPVAETLPEKPWTPTVFDKPEPDKLSFFRAPHVPPPQPVAETLPKTEVEKIRERMTRRALEIAELREALEQIQRETIKAPEIEIFSTGFVREKIVELLTQITGVKSINKLTIEGQGDKIILNTQITAKRFFITTDITLKNAILL